MTFKLLESIKMEHTHRRYIILNEDSKKMDVGKLDLVDMVCRNIKGEEGDKASSQHHNPPSE